MRGARLYIGLVALFLVAACDRSDEDKMRARVAGWFQLGETLAFSARTECAVGAFRLVDDMIGSGLLLESSVPQMLVMLGARPAVAVEHPELSPDQAMMDAANTKRDTGMAMRRAALEARPCMDDRFVVAFRQVLEKPGAILAYDAQEKAVMLVDRQKRLLIVVMGEGK